MVYQYVPILRWKRGEQVALGQLSVAGKQDVFPLIVLQNEQYKGKKATKVKGAINSADVIAECISRCWGKKAFYLDATALPDKLNGQHPLDDIATSARVQGLQLIPTTNLSASTAYNNAVQSAFITDKAGVALRVDLGEFANAKNWASKWPIPFPETDLIADLSSNTRVVQQVLGSVNSTFQNLHLASQWRTVTVAGTSMPPNFSGLTQGVHLISRVEHIIWQTIASNVSYRLDYGDYATVPLGVLPADIAWGYPINARYTLKTDFLICKGVKTTGLGGVDMEPQLIQHANTINAYPQRNALSHCWADTQIDAIAATAIGPSNLATWVQYSVNRHIELIRNILP